MMRKDPLISAVALFSTLPASALVGQSSTTAAPITIPLTLGIGIGLAAAGGAVVGQLVGVALR